MILLTQNQSRHAPPLYCYAVHYTGTHGLKSKCPYGALPFLRTWYNVRYANNEQTVCKADNERESASLRVLRKERIKMAFIPRPQEIYKHFKGNLYQVLTIAEHSETGEQLVIYQAMYGDYKVYAREVSMFTSLVDKEKYPQVEQLFRFELQGPGSARQQEAYEESLQVLTRQHVSAAPCEESQAQEAVETVAEPAVQLQREEEKAGKEATAEDANPGIDPLVWEFLDADTYHKRLQILNALHHRITDEMITTMSIACDMEVPDGDLEKRYESLKACLETREHYEGSRLR